MSNLSTQQEKAKPQGGRSTPARSSKVAARNRRATSKSGTRLLAEAKAYLADPNVKASKTGKLLAEMMQALDDSMQAAGQATATEPQGEPALFPEGSTTPPENLKFMAEMRSQALEQRKRDIASGVVVSAAELAERLQLSKQAVSAAVRANRMFVLDGPSGEGYIPAFFADGRYDRPTLEKVSKALGGLSGASKWQFFITPRECLGGKSPLQAVAKGKGEQVMAAAASFLDE